MDEGLSDVAMESVMGMFEHHSRSQREDASTLGKPCNAHVCLISLLTTLLTTHCEYNRFFSLDSRVASSLSYLQLGLSTGSCCGTRMMSLRYSDLTTRPTPFTIHCHHKNQLGGYGLVSSWRNTSNCQQEVNKQIEKRSITMGSEVVASNDLAVVEDDWKLPMDFELFAAFVQQKVYYSASDHFVIECVESLTPLDMTSLSSGTHDATGLCAWRGAFLLLSMLDQIQEFIQGSRNVLELGAGTGLDGIALLKSGIASTMCFTDADPSANGLCRRNCETNQLLPSSYHIEELRWGEPLPSSIQPQYFDAVIAADVIYDIGLLPILLQSAADCLRADGHLILSHVPRASYNTNHPPVDSLEQLIILRAKETGFELARVMRPDPNAETWTAPCQSLNYMVGGSFEDMSDVGASILIFRRI